jgi:hypothetical protein
MAGGNKSLEEKKIDVIFILLIAFKVQSLSNKTITLVLKIPEVICSV